MTGRLIGIGGYAGSGKDAVADILEDSHGFYGTFMSQPLNAALCRLNPQVEVRPGEVFRYVDLIAQLGYTRAKELPEVRRLLQAMGTEVGRDMFGQTIWVDLMRNNLAAYEPDDDVVVTGIRFPNEASMIHELGGELWWTYRPGYGPVNSHSSDNTLSLRHFDRVVVNDGTLEDLEQLVTKMLQNQSSSSNHSK